MPLFKDDKFGKDREDFSGRPWTKEFMDRGRPEALVAVRKGFALLERLLADGRDWILGSKEVSLGDLEGESLAWNTFLLQPITSSQ